MTQNEPQILNRLIKNLTHSLKNFYSTIKVIYNAFKTRNHIY